MTARSRGDSEAVDRVLEPEATTARLDKTDRDNPDVVPGTQVAKRQFGRIRVTGPGDARRLSFESYDGAGELLWRHEVRANDLRLPGTQGPRP